jgi:hypothetical protein
MQRRYQLVHPIYGKGFKFTELRNALKEQRQSIPVGEWRIYDRQDRKEIA